MRKQKIALISGTALTAVLCFLFLAGCSASSRSGASAPTVSEGDPDAFLAELQRLYDTGRYQAADSLARVIVTVSPEFPGGDEALYVGALASKEINSPSQTVRYAEQLAEKYPLSPRLDESLKLAADAYRKLGQYYQSADMLSRMLSSPLKPAMRERCLADLRELASESLGVADLERLIDAYPSSPLAAEMSLGLAKKEFARGDYDKAYALLADLLYEFPQHTHSREIRYLLQVSADRRDDPERTVDFVEPNKMGVLLPYTGGFSRFGRYFEQGVRVAVDEFADSSGIAVTYVIGDSKADPVAAVGAVRRLFLEEGVVAVLGSVFTMPSISAATECNAWKVPIVSPMVTDRNLSDLVAWVFQTKVPVEVEVSAMARLAVEDLMLERIAVFAPSTPGGRSLADAFTAEVEKRGGEIAAQDFFGLGDTDFREQLQKIRQTAPDGLFIPGATDELVNILPQISFYDLQIQLLGLSNWNSEKLLNLSGRELEGAVFPREGYFGRDPGAYQRFVGKYLETYAGEDRAVSESGEVHPVAVAGYFGSMFILEAIAAGAVDREQLREFLDLELNAGADARMSQVRGLPLVRVSSGRVYDFTVFDKDE